MKRVLPFFIAVVIAAGASDASGRAFAVQGKGGEVRSGSANGGTTTTRSGRSTGTGGNTSRGGRGGSGGGSRTGGVSTFCEQADLVVRCGMAGCGISIEGRQKPVFTDDSGEVAFSLSGEAQATITVTKSGYETVKQSLKLKCGEENLLAVKLKGQVSNLRIRTSQPDAEVYVNEKLQGRSNAQGEFSFKTTEASLLVEARKNGYLSTNQLIKDTRASASNEIVLMLRPNPAAVVISANAEDARVQVDDQQDDAPASEKIKIPPGHHTFTVKALGYAPLTFEIDLAPDETGKRDAPLQRLPVDALKAQAEEFYRNRTYQNVLKLCQYIFETDPNHPSANRLAGLSYLAQQNYAKAEIYLARALAGGEKIELRVRRHPRESFDPVKGHDVCEAVLILSKGELEFQGKQYAAENFKVAFTQVQISGIQLKSGVAVYLATKIFDAGGKKKEYNFYSYDRELSQAGRAYLEMVQHLIRAH